MLMLVEEAVPQVLHESDDGSELRGLLNNAAEEARKGVALIFPQIVCVAKKSSNAIKVD